MLFVSIVISNVSSLLVYDRQTLLDLCPSAKDFAKIDHDHDGHTTFQSLHFSGIPTHLWRTLPPLLQRKRRRRQGKRSGELVKLKALSARFPVASRGDTERYLASFSTWVRWTLPTPGWYLSSGLG